MKTPNELEKALNGVEPHVAGLQARLAEAEAKAASRQTAFNHAADRADHFRARLAEAVDLLERMWLTSRHESTCICSLCERVRKFRRPSHSATLIGSQQSMNKDHEAWLLQQLADLDATKARLAEAEREANLYHVVMESWRSTKMKHGLCQPRERMACTHCNAVDRLDAMLATYKGRRLVASVAGLTISAPVEPKP